ncbi:hypothetical protein SORBI_3005G213900 [Sorghum bicolor]|uniref:Knottin scorpion toxin-like domain-containing protein n=1 Tax=Sorghum bicolor TaxID=4558 RepID=A0A1B6PTX6_SORBI|nr:hypothetical protein SORBI_3005G213900 [Sorghum bicolor]
METSRRSLYAGFVIVLLLIVVTGHGTAPTQGFGDGPGPLPPCYHWSTYYHGLCVWNEICTGLCRRQDRSQFIRGTCRGYPAKCFCLSC